ncbi:MAG: HNH endonuclease signature motif containing protein, partial [Motilibacteraceae bacterium]
LVDAEAGQPAGYLPGLTEHGDRLAPATLRRLACDAKLVPAVLGSRGQPLDLGREVRLATATIYRARAVEFGGCCGIGCTAPPSQTTAHHLDHWADDGPTSLANSAPLCGHEHWLVHEGGWDLRRTSEPGVVEWRPPAWIDPSRPWIRREPPPR